MTRPFAGAVCALLSAASMLGPSTPAGAADLPPYMNTIVGTSPGNAGETATKNVLTLNTIMFDLYGDAATGGITGAEFRVDGWPAGWFGAPTRNPAANIDVGSPIAGGTNIAFPTCQSPDGNGIVLLFTINGLATSVPSNLVLKTLPHTVPSNPNFVCPLVTICDDVFTKVCVAGGEAFINGPTCNVAVTPASWSTVKSLYNN